MSPREKNASHPVRNTIAGSLLGAPLAAALGWIAYSRLFIPHDLHLPPAVEAQQREVQGRAGRISYYAAGSGRPMLLLHSINAAASAYEVRPIFEHYRRSRSVYAPDLPGFGFSDRSNRDYTPRLYADAILDMLDEIQRDSGAEPVDAVALSLTCEFLARAANDRPDRFRTLTLVTPTAFGEDEQYYGTPDSTLGNPRTKRTLEFPLWSRPLFDLINSRPSQQYFLAKTFSSAQAVNPGLLDYDYLTAHRPDAQYAPYAFLAGLLFSADIDRVYESLQMPVWMPYGLWGDFSDIADVTNVSTMGNWLLQPFQTGGLPFFEQPDQFFAAMDDFLVQRFEEGRLHKVYERGPEELASSGNGGYAAERLSPEPPNEFTQPGDNPMEHKV